MNLREYSKNRPFELTGTIVLAAFPAGLFTYCWAIGLRKGMIVFGLILAGQLAQWIISVAAWNKARKLLPLLLAMLAPLAQAIIPIAIALGVAVGVLGLGIIKIWSHAMSIELQNAARPIIVPHAAITGPHPSNLGFAAVTPSPSQAQPVAIAAAAAPAVARGVSLFVPAGHWLERSTNLVDWSIVGDTVTQDTITDMPAGGPYEFFRVNTAVRATD